MISVFLPILTLKNMKTDFLPFRRFLRVHKSHLVNLYKMVRLIKGEKYFVEMSDRKIVPVSRQKQRTLLDRLRELGLLD